VAGVEQTRETSRERGWKGILAALVVFLLVPQIDLLRVVVPIEQTLLLVVPGIAASALVGWWVGGRFWLALAWVAASAWMLAHPLGTAPAYDALARGWAILLAAVFGVVHLAGARRPFLSRGLSTIALTFAIAISIVLVSSVSPSRVQRSLSDELNRRAATWNANAARLAESPRWQRVQTDFPKLAQFLNVNERLGQVMPQAARRLFPALLALESLAGLALAWGLYHRISRTRIGPPLGALQSFRLNDQLVWGFVAGFTIIVIPSLAGVRELGLNLAIFFGVLYALRGLGVLTWFLAPRRVVAAFFLVLVLASWLGLWLVSWRVPVALFVALVAVSIGLGLGDTWLDWRGRVRQVT
jgi:hypothetical protein